MTKYAKYTKTGEAAKYYPEEVADSASFDTTPVSTLPEGAALYNGAVRISKPYLPEGAKRVLNYAQFGSIQNDAQQYGMSMDFRNAEIPHADWVKLGFNRISKFCSDQVDGSNPFSALPDIRKCDNATESSLHGSLEGHGYWAATLAQMELQYYNNIPAYGPGAHWWANIETSNYWSRDYYKNDDGSGGIGHYPRWIAVKGDSIQLESSAAVNTFGPSCSLETLFSNSGIQQIEAGVRRANRCSIMLKVAGRNGAYVGYGSAIVQGEPRTDALTDSGRYLDEQDANVTNINSGAGAGNITFSGPGYNRSYTNITGSFYKHETVQIIYNYYFEYTYTDSGTDFNSINNYPDLWARIHNRHRIAYEFSVCLGVDKRLRDVHNGSTIPTIRQHQLFYEGNFSRVPSAIGTPLGDGGYTKVWLPPVYIRIQRIVHHFYQGDRPGSMYHVFNSEGAPNQGIVYNMGSNPKYNHHMHTVSALVAAGRDMESILDVMAGTILTTDIDIKVGGTGSFVNINPVQAYAHGPNGSNGTLLPCFGTRHKTTSEGLSVLICGGMDQSDSTTRVDIIRIPGVGNGNTVRLDYKGQDVQLFHVVFPNGVSNTEFSAKSIVSAWQKPGYGGRINNA